MSVISSPALFMGEDGYQISRSVRLRSSASAYFSRTPGTNTSAQKGTISFWVKRGTLSTTYTQYLYQSSQNSAPYRDNHIGFTSGNNLEVYFSYQTSVGGGWNDSIYLSTSAVFRDPSAWYHIVFAWDTTQATASNRAKLYVNGQQVTAFSTATYPTLNENLLIDTSGYTDFIGWSNGGGVFLQVTPFDGYITEFNRVDGQALTPSSFGAYNAYGVWSPLKYNGTYGNNGFYLNFSDNSGATSTTIGKDYSGNGNNWTPNNISVTSGVTYDSMLDVPTMWADGNSGRGNYAVLSPLDKGSGTISDGNLTFASLGNMVKASIGMSSGKWYWEINNPGSTTLLGISSITDPVGSYVGSGSGGYSYGASNGNKNNNATSVAYGATFGNTDTIGVAFDADAGTLTFYKNNTSQGTAFSSIPAGTYFPAVSYNTGGTTSGYANFGQRPFTYTPPSGFKALNTQNLPAGSTTTSGSFTGNANADGPFVYLNGVPTAMTINGNAVTFATHVDKTANGFKLRTSSSSYNASGSNTYSITTTGAKFKYANAQVNP